VDSAAERRLVALVAGMLAELRGGAPPPVSLDDELERGLGIDSLARVELVLRIESEFAVRLPEALVAQARTPRELLEALSAAGPRRAPDAAVVAAAPPLEPAGEPRAAATLLEALHWHAERHAQRTHLTLIEDPEAPGEALSYAALAVESRALAAALQARGLERGQSVAIMLPTGRAFFRAFMGTLLAGGVPVPIYPPARWSQIEEHLRRQARILANCGAPVLLTVAQAQPVARLLQLHVPTLRHVLNAAELLSTNEISPGASPSAGDVALIQYTSGSTGQPKGVVLTHANLLANIRAMGAAVQASSRDVFVSWLPLYHDMGLIGAWLGSLYFGVPLVLMPPQSFLARPSRWLWAIHRYRATLSAGPNFAYEILAAKVPDDELRGLDLSSWRVAFNGAEPVRAATLDKFAERFARSGFEARAAAPVYGLAECGLGLTFPPLGRGPLVDQIDAGVLAREGRAQGVAPGEAAGMRVVSCGQPLAGHEVRIVDAMGGEAPERVEGRIEFRGPSACTGYFNNPEATARLLRDGWLDTGDVGYMAGGELFVTSRVKDLIIRGGQHIHPYDLEEAVGALPGVRKGCVAVFGAADPASGSERVVVVAETRATGERERRELRRRIAALAETALGVPADDIALVGERVVLKTSSGKIRRAACRELYERGLLGAAQRPVTLQLVRLALGGAAASARAVLRLAGALLYGAYAWLVFALLAAAGAAVLLVLPPRAARRWSRSVARALVALSRIPLRVEGAQRLAGALPAVVIANHASYADSIVLMAVLPLEARFAAKAEFARHPVAGPLMRRMGVRFVERFATLQAIEDAHAIARAVAAGESPVLFPEGTFTRAPGLRAFHLGAFAAAAESGRPVVPVALRGTRSVLRDGSWLPRRHGVEVIVGAPLVPRDTGWSEALRLRDEARRAILAGCGEPDAAAHG
jgi:1-acyl-sn-glycerol-3-phosphate acyltransferase